MGDELLIAVAQRLAGCTRANDTVARLGGDEFAVLIGAQHAPGDGDALAERLSDAFTRPYAIRGHEFQLGASIGRAVFPTDADSAEDLLRFADTEMFKAKPDHHEAATQLARRTLDEPVAVDS
jgi:diguanylate cyclase (GGDEF)-like protein